MGETAIDGPNVLAMIGTHQRAGGVVDVVSDIQIGDG